MDIRKIRTLVEILEASDLAEIEIQEGEESIRLSRYPAGGPPMPTYAMPMQQMHAPQPAPAAASSGPAAGGKSAEEEEMAEGHVIRSPMVGTYYAAPNPDSEPFVRIGQQVKAGDTVCVIEAMKMFNQIESDTDGKVVAILVENGQPVEFDQALFIVR